MFNVDPRHRYSNANIVDLFLLLDDDGSVTITTEELQRKKEFLVNDWGMTQEVHDELAKVVNDAQEKRDAFDRQAYHKADKEKKQSEHRGVGLDLFLETFHKKLDTNSTKRHITSLSLGSRKRRMAEP